MTKRRALFMEARTRLARAQKCLDDAFAGPDASWDLPFDEAQSCIKRALEWVQELIDSEEDNAA
jgi:hypothetical protein